MKPRDPRANLAACLLPWTDTFAFDEAAFERHVQGAIDAKYRDVYLMGTAGEGYALSDAQFQQIVRRFAKILAARPEVRGEVGMISLSMQQMIERIDFARALGIKSFQISLPSWGALSDAEVMGFFTGVCSRFTDCRFLHYNLPRTKRILNGADYRRVADACPNLVATKNSTSDYTRVADLMRNAGDLQHFFLENGFAFGATLGECSLLCSYGMLFPKSTWKFFEAGARKDHESLWRLHKAFDELGGVLWASAGDHIDGAYDKMIAWLADPSFPTRLLPPYLGFADDEARAVREAYETRAKKLFEPE